MTLRELLDDTILRLGLCDRVDLMRVRGYLNAIEAQRGVLRALSHPDRLEPEDRALDTPHAFDPGDPEIWGGKCRLCGAHLLATPLHTVDSMVEFSPERHLTPAGGPAPYESIEIVREGGAG
jgi:hypothetical protein